jgi:hypothetical protein
MLFGHRGVWILSLLQTRSPTRFFSSNIVLLFLLESLETSGSNGGSTRPFVGSLSSSSWDLSQLVLIASVAGSTHELIANKINNTNIKSISSFNLNTYLSHVITMTHFSLFSNETSRLVFGIPALQLMICRRKWASELIA